MTQTAMNPSPGISGFEYLHPYGTQADGRPTNAADLYGAMMGTGAGYAQNLIKNSMDPEYIKQFVQSLFNNPEIFKQIANVQQEYPGQSFDSAMDQVGGYGHNFTQDPVTGRQSFAQQDFADYNKMMTPKFDKMLQAKAGMHGNGVAFAPAGNGTVWDSTYQAMRAPADLKAYESSREPAKTAISGIAANNQRGAMQMQGILAQLFGQGATAATQLFGNIASGAMGIAAHPGQNVQLQSNAGQWNGQGGGGMSGGGVGGGGGGGGGMKTTGEGTSDSKLDMTPTDRFSLGWNPAIAANTAKANLERQTAERAIAENNTHKGTKYNWDGTLINNDDNNDGSSYTIFGNQGF